MKRAAFRHVPAYAGAYNKYIKRILDILLSACVLLVIFPLFPIISLAVVLEDGFPVFYRAERGGYEGKPFRICKFRTMVRDADKIGGGTTSLNDSRITKVGRFLRRIKLDEIPQFAQVLTGKMSLVGPRPELLRYVSRYQGEELDILKVRPGITDFSSVAFINLDEIVGTKNADEMYEKLVLKRKNELRVQYAHSVSFCTDLRILWLTAVAVAKKCFRT